MHYHTLHGARKKQPTSLTIPKGSSEWCTIGAIVEHIGESFEPV